MRAGVGVALACAAACTSTSTPPSPPDTTSGFPDLEVQLASCYYGDCALVEDGDDAYVWSGYYMLIAGEVHGGTKRVMVTPEVHLWTESGPGDRLGGSVGGEPVEVKLTDWAAEDGSGWFQDVKAILGSHPQYDEMHEWCGIGGWNALPILLTVVLETEDGRVVTEEVDLRANNVPMTGVCGTMPL